MQKMLTTNVTGIVWLSNLVLPQMAERRDGVILIISSVGGFIGSDVLGFYNMSKAAEQSLARSPAYEWGARNIRVNCIAPGLIKTDFSRVLWQDEDVLAKRTATSAATRLGVCDVRRSRDGEFNDNSSCVPQSFSIGLRRAQSRLSDRGHAR
jgi:NAD(P)-dependent dehydrogenase (short-subunit alcohol dehydrogenase family)